MGADILQLGGGRDVQPTRMDGTRQRGTPASGGGFAAEKDGGEKNVSFRKVMDDVKMQNRVAEKSSRKTTSSESRDTMQTRKSRAPEATDGDRESVANGETDDGEESAVHGLKDLFSFVQKVATPEDNDEETVLVDEEDAGEACELVTGVFDELADVLGIQLIGDAEQFSLTELSDDTKGQFAEIIHVMRSMLTVMEECAGNGTAVELPGRSVSGDELQQLTDTLRTATFKLEMACNLLGIADAVQQRIDAASGTTAAAGIMQATDPSTLSMVQQHVERLFGKMFGDSSSVKSHGDVPESLRTIVADGNGTPVQMTVTSGDGTAQEELSGTAHFESQVYRTLLKIDAMHKTGEENKAAGNDDGTAPMSGEESRLLVADNPAEAVSAEDGGMASIDGIKTGEVKMPVQEAKLPDALARMTEESVTRQVTEKLHTVIRSGLSEVRIHLRPESLGEVKMRIQMDGDVVLAKIEVQNQQVKEIMERNFGALKDALAQHNITAGSLEVQVGNGGGRQGGGNQQAWFDDDAPSGFEQHDDDKDEQRSTGEQVTTTHSETGRRYGDNSIEYFG